MWVMFLLLALHGSQVYATNDSSRCILVSFSMQLVEDYSLDDTYYYTILNTNTWGYHEALGKATPQFSVSYSSIKSINEFTIRFNNTFGFQSAEQRYTGYYEAVTNADSTIWWPIINDVLVYKYYLFYRAEVKIAVKKHFFISPVFQMDYRIGEHLQKNVTVLSKFGVYDADNHKLLYHPKANFKLGGQLGATFWNRYQFGFNMLHGLNKSITVKPDHKWYNRQVGWFINYRLFSWDKIY